MKTHFLIKKVTKKWRFVNIKNTDKAKNFIIHNARSLELSLYEYFYEKAGYNSTDKTAFIQWLEMDR